MMRKVILYTDPEDGGWVASIPSLPGCFSEGETKEEALRNIRDAAMAWLEAAESEGVMPSSNDVLVAIDHIELPTSPPPRRKSKVLHR